MRATRKRFVEWLTSRSEAEVVGYAQQCSTCPLAYFLLFLEPNCMPHVDGENWTRWEGDGPNGRWRKMPAWAIDVVGCADDLQGAITSAELRQMLRLIGWPEMV